MSNLWMSQPLCHKLLVLGTILIILINLKNFPQALATYLMQEPMDDLFFVNSGASTYMTNDSSKPSFIRPYKVHDLIYVGNEAGFPITHRCDINNGNIHLKDVPIVLDHKMNLLSVGMFVVDNPSTFAFNSNGFVIKDQNNRVIVKGS